MDKLKTIAKGISLFTVIFVVLYGYFLILSTFLGIGFLGVLWIHIGLAVMAPVFYGVGRAYEDTLRTPILAHTFPLLCKFIDMEKYEWRPYGSYPRPKPHSDRLYLIKDKNHSIALAYIYTQYPPQITEMEGLLRLFIR